MATTLAHVFAVALVVAGGTAAAQPSPGCVAGCQGQGRISAAQLPVIVGIALGTRAFGDCGPGDTSGDGEITAGEVIAAVGTVAGVCMPVAEIIDFGPAFGVPGAQTQLPFDLAADLTIGSIHIDVAFDAAAFSFDSCSPFYAELVASTNVTAPGMVSVDVVPSTPGATFTIPSGTFMNCAFNVIGSAGIYPVSLHGVFTDDHGTRTVFTAQGTFTIQCFDPAQCPPGQTCDFDTSMCVPAP